MILNVVNEAVATGSRRDIACETVGLSVRTVERWRSGKLEDQRRGPHPTPANKLSLVERQVALKLLNEPRFRDLSPNQIVPQLADEDRYVASEATLYRLLREENLLQHRGHAKAPTRRLPHAHVATGQNQSWDITYLKSTTRGVFFYLYMVVDV